jgi:hypothetical protein
VAEAAPAEEQAARQSETKVVSIDSFRKKS